MSSFDFSLNIKSNSTKAQDLMIDYIIHHQKANAKTSPKVFKWRKINLPANAQIALNKCHPFRQISTRKYYAGPHKIEIIINGQKMEKQDFTLHKK